MTVRIDRYDFMIHNNGKGHINNLLHREEIVSIQSRNKKLTRKLLTLCLDYLNKNEEYND